MQPIIEQARIRELIPHTGTMCLLESVISWDPSQIECRVRNHSAADNPLRHLGRLSAVHLIEYAAQAAAVHGALLNASKDRQAPGLLVALRDCELLQDALDPLAAPLVVIANRQLANRDGLIYQFTITADDHTPLARGRLSVMLAQ